MVKNKVNEMLDKALRTYNIDLLYKARAEGADANAVSNTPFKMNALHEVLDQQVSFAKCQNDFIEKLIEFSDVTIPSGSGATALHYAVQNDHTKAVELILLKELKDVNKADLAGRTPLHVAVDTGRIEMVERLLTAGAIPFAVDKNGTTPLHLASEKDVRIVEILAEGASEKDINSKDKQGRNALFRAVSFNIQPRSVKLLLEKGVKSKETDSENRTLLHYLAEAMSSYEGALDPSWDKHEALQSFEEVALLLLRSGIDPGARDNSGKTALDLAQGPYTKTFLGKAVTG